MQLITIISNWFQTEAEEEKPIGMPSLTQNQTQHLSLTFKVSVNRQSIKEIACH